MPPTQRSNPIPFLPHDQLIAAAEIPHVAAWCSPSPFSHRCRWAQSILQQRVPQGGSAQSRQLISFQVCVHILAISSRKLYVFLPDRVSRKEVMEEFSQ